MRRQQPNGSQDRMTPEFMEWLKLKNVTRRQLRKDPAALDLYHQEWTKTRRKHRPKRPSLLQMIPSLNNMDLGAVVGNVQIAKELFNAYRDIRGKSIFKNI
ncbi:hypothetical protein [Brevibacillus choshinensis]|uniref:hypothetical protein n=1 Tax=Brevibacillus choshinensis TaxID=54911 RepID=UPI002E1CF59E|nr:hypothetical protein [Brevibacillus choshinensis]MED4754582.1 hypothetical protein [Brevibacillus choshinensis]MED4785217.1 hypothetical protein [Brevibacillus choshinensis]